MRDRVDVFLQTGANSWLSFDDPARVIRADSVEEVRAAIADVERLTRYAGLHAVGFVAYEAGRAFGIPTARSHMAQPLVWFALFEPRNIHPAPPPSAQGRYSLGSVAPSVDRAAFEAAFARIKAHLADGDSYQVNFTFKMAGTFDGDEWALFSDLVGAQQGSHSAFIRTGDWAVCSASPELFFAIDGLTVRARPMKGTAVRGRTLPEDHAQRDRLRSSAKQQAENVMIVDMVRSDLGRIAVAGTIEVPELFTVERYPNVWQMTSSVTGRSAAPLEEVFAAVHPSASVTGAPKVRTAEILAALERGPRGVYTGAIGHVPPDGNASFNVAIRTAVIDRRTNTIEFGIGSGIVWDSDPAAEYEECLAKGSVLGRRPVRFELLETLRWSPREGFALLERHLARLRDTAEYFSYTCDIQKVRAELQQAVEGREGPLRVRLLVADEGSVRVEHAPLSIDDRALRVVVGSTPVDSRDVSLFHKTTNRNVYERARAAAPACDDVILWNERQEVTESTVANVVVEIAGARWTPPVECGLLAGTYRSELLERGEIRERVISVEELRAAAHVWLVNSVQGKRKAILLAVAVVLLAAAVRVTAQTASSVAKLAQEPRVQAALESARESEPQTIEDQIRFCEVPAPPFKESARAEVLRRAFQDVGLRNIRTDRVGNVLADRPGQAPRPRLVVAAHLDTVFPEGTDVKVKRSAATLRGPGIGDNCRGLAVLVAVARAMKQADVQTPGTVTFVANVGEEGLGDLRGMKALFGESMNGQIDQFVSIDNGGSHISTVGIGSRRYRITFKGPGGHSLGDFGVPNPAGALGRAVAKIAEFQVPITPRTTFNVGRIGGGTSVNAIPEDAWMEVDLRSTSPDALAALEARLQQALERAAAEENARWRRPGAVTVTKTLVGDRPAGRQSENSTIVMAASAAASVLGISAPLSESSSDANLPMSLKIPAITIGAGGRSEGAHTLDESFETSDAWKGTQHALLITVALAR